jgi:AcrR family transcriptional regulator
MNTPNLDDRRSQRTRRLLHKALTELMQEKRYDKISVQDIIDRADVGRSTFYAHFQDKEELAVSGLEDMLDQLVNNLDAHPAGEHAPILPTLVLFNHVYEKQDMFKALTKGHAMDLFLEQGQEYWTRRMSADLQARLPQGFQPKIPIPVLATYIAGSLVTLLKWWLDNKMPYSPKTMQEMADQLLLPGLLAGLGLPPDHLDAAA